jgi:ComF family protein
MIGTGSTRNAQDQIDLSILSHHLLNIGANFARLLPAQPCLLCGAASHDGLCCSACAAELPRLDQAHCPICALPTLNASVCGQCLQHPPPFEHTVAAFSYDFPLDQLIQSLKFHEHLILVDFLADAVVQRVSSTPDSLLPMPLHPARLRERGFNQSALLAQRIAQRLHIPLLRNACERIRNTTPQSKLPLKERDKNMRLAFSCKPAANIHGKHIAIVDDVMTSGASISELARVLKQAGASEVSAWVVARTLPHDH